MDHLRPTSVNDISAELTRLNKLLKLFIGVYFALHAVIFALLIQINMNISSLK